MKGTGLLADLQAFLDDMKAPLHLVPHRVRYYSICIKAIACRQGSVRHGL